MLGEGWLISHEHTNLYMILKKLTFLSLIIKITTTSYLVGGLSPFEKYARQNGFIFPKIRGENKTYLSCHHLVIDLNLLVQCSSIKVGKSPLNHVGQMVIYHPKW